LHFEKQGSKYYLEINKAINDTCSAPRVNLITVRMLQVSFFTQNQGGVMENNQYFGTEKVGKLLAQFAIPCIFSLIISCFYNIVDQIFVGSGVFKCILRKK